MNANILVNSYETHYLMVWWLQTLVAAHTTGTSDRQLLVSCYGTHERSPAGLQEQGVG